MIRRPPRSTLMRSSAASDVYKRQVLGPLMLELKVLPEVTQAVSSVTVLFTGISSVAQFLILGKVPWDYGLLMFLFGVFSSLVGMKGLGYLVKKYNKKSLVIFAIAIIVGLSILLLVVAGVLEIAASVASGNSDKLNFKPFC
eukprot:TRINITY_DN3397_c0_g3_i2.p1 TRINITY_DN3397_c0_g3~~TRINITY_DN3397_c0_g3_i2.p1  ORF type:complete len:142 (+),score=23.23 TRINITY_DN3397_c0_g3_i2:2-427(+)